MATSPVDERAKIDGRREVGERTRKRLIEATQDLLAERGEEGLRIREITAAAETNVAAVHYHFGGLKSLCLAAITEAFETLLEAQSEEFAALPGDASIEEVVEVWVRRRAAGFLGSGDGPALIAVVARLVHDSPPDMRDWVADATRRASIDLNARLRPLLPELDDEELAFRTACVAGIVHHLRTPYVQELVSGDTIDEVVERVTSMAVCLLRADLGDRARAPRAQKRAPRRSREPVPKNRL